MQIKPYPNIFLSIDKSAIYKNVASELFRPYELLTASLKKDSNFKVDVFQV